VESRGEIVIPLDDLPAPAANRDRKMRVTFDPKTWPDWLLLAVLGVLIVAAMSVAR
jgi:hypothetical protein